MAKLSNTKVCHYLENDNVWVTPRGRSIFVFLHKPVPKKGGLPGDKYAASLMFDPALDLGLLDKAACDALKDKFGITVKTLLDGDAKIKDPVKKTTKVFKSPFLPADEKLADVTSAGEPVDLEGWKQIRTHSKRQPKVRNDAGVELDLDGIETEAYSGRWMRIMVRPFCYEVDGNQGVSFGLESVQLLRNDDAIGGGGAPVSGDAFGAAEDEDEDDV